MLVFSRLADSGSNKSLFTQTEISCSRSWSHVSTSLVTQICAAVISTISLNLLGSSIIAYINKYLRLQHLRKTTQLLSQGPGRRQLVRAPSRRARTAICFTTGLSETSIYSVIQKD